MANNDKCNAIRRVIEKNYKVSDEDVARIFEKYASMGGTFSCCGSTKDELILCVNDEFNILENIVYTLGIPFRS